MKGDKREKIYVGGGVTAPVATPLVACLLSMLGKGPEQEGRGPMAAEVARSSQITSTVFIFNIVK